MQLTIKCDNNVNDKWQNIKKKIEKKKLKPIL